MFLLTLFIPGVIKIWFLITIRIHYLANGWHDLDVSSNSQSQSKYLVSLCRLNDLLRYLLKILRKMITSYHIWFLEKKKKSQYYDMIFGYLILVSKDFFKIYLPIFYFFSFDWEDYYISNGQDSVLLHWQIFSQLRKFVKNRGC